MADELKLGYVASMAYHKLGVIPNKFNSTGEYMAWLSSHIDPTWEYRITQQTDDTLRRLDDLGRTIILLGVATPRYMFAGIDLVATN